MQENLGLRHFGVKIGDILLFYLMNIRYLENIKLFDEPRRKAKKRPNATCLTVPIDEHSLFLSHLNPLTRCKTPYLIIVIIHGINYPILQG